MLPKFHSRKLLPYFTFVKATPNYAIRFDKITRKNIALNKMSQSNRKIYHKPKKYEI